MSALPRYDDSPDPAFRRVRRVVLGDFRSYAALDLRVDAQMAALTGDNGAGKTNLIEALSLFSPGRGLRRADLGDMARNGGRGGFAVSLEIESADGLAQLGTGLEAADGDAPAARKCRIDRAPVGSPRAFADHLRLVWLTPAMDGLFAGSAGERRRFLDRVVLSVDADHGARVSGLERALRNRNRLLEERWSDAAWLDAAEREVAELGVAVAAARSETVARLAALIAAGRHKSSAFPFAEIELLGDVERLVVGRPALEAGNAGGGPRGRTGPGRPADRRSARAPRAETGGGRAVLDGRAEGAACRSGSGAGPPRGGHERRRAAGAARRDRRAFRSGPPRRAFRRFDRVGRAGVDDGR